MAQQSGLRVLSLEVEAARDGDFSARTLCRSAGAGERPQGDRESGADDGLIFDARNLDRSDSGFAGSLPDAYPIMLNDPQAALRAFRREQRERSAEEIKRVADALRGRA